ncbi:MAG: hypothetical protein HY548_06905 [Elusimicrobia bacterium]|nr:hypothetical protein [Elusimicrobiota bacterium]
MTKPDTAVIDSLPSLVSDEWKEEDFLNYDGEGRPYQKIWKQYNSVEDCVKILEQNGHAGIESVVVLGTATGEILKFFDSTWNTRPYGCELSAWAYRQIPHPYRRRIKNQDLRHYVKECRMKVDMVYANSFMYLEEQDVPWVLKECARIARFLFADLSYSECYAENDRYRKILKPHRWWRDRFREAGFVPFKKYRRLWQSALTHYPI